MKKDVVVLILAAGIGKRFWPFVTDKSIFPIFDEPNFLHNIRKLSDAGFSRFIIVTNPFNDAAVRSASKLSVPVETVIQKEPKGMGDAVLAAKTLIAGASVLVVNAEDVVSDTLYHDIADAIHKGEAFAVGKKASEYFDGGYLKLSGNQLVGIVEKPGRGKEPSQLINLVFHYFPHVDDFLGCLKATQTLHDDVYERAFDRYMKDHMVSVLPYNEHWSPFKYPWQVLDAMNYRLHHGMKPGRGKHVEIRNNVSIEGLVYLGNNVRIFENTKLVGPLYIGDNTIIGNNNMVRESVIGAQCVTGFNTDITRSYIGDHCWFHSNYIGDSVLEGNISMGSGSVLANLRLDEGEISSMVRGERVNTRRTKLGAMIAENVRIGVNTSIMPGVKIGSGSMIGAGIVLDHDIAAGSFCVAKPGYEIMKNTKVVSPGTRSNFKSKL